MAYYGAPDLFYLSINGRFLLQFQPHYPD